MIVFDKKLQSVPGKTIAERMRAVKESIPKLERAEARLSGTCICCGNNNFSHKSSMRYMARSIKYC